MGRDRLAGSHGDAANAVLAAVGDNVAGILAWPRLVSSLVARALGSPKAGQDGAQNP